MKPGIEELRERLGELADVGAATALLSWDQETYMPPKGATGRGQQLATLSALAHRLFTTAAMGDLLKWLKDGADGLSPDESKLVDETLYHYERATRLPESFVQEFAEEQSKAYHVWVKAREQSAFGVFEPNLERLVGLLRRKADLLGYSGSPYNALLEEFERGMTAEQLRDIFGTLALRQSALVKRIMNAPGKPDTAWLDQEWSESAQWAFALRVLRDMGYDLEAGRMDRAVHPFTISLGLRDVRVTTRVHARQLLSCLLAAMHEGGHGLYDQGFREEDARTTLAEAPSLGMHESQSRMWENVVGRSLAFWTHYTPVLRDHFPGQLDTVTPNQIYSAVNSVAPSLIRVEADECTYNLHIILRFEIEVDILEGRVRLCEVPEIWNAKMKQYLDIDVPDDAHGCLQDVHWSHGAFGYFPTYALGNLYAAQLFETAAREISDLESGLASGNLIALRDWLRDRIHRPGRRKTARNLIRDVTGAEPSAEPYLRYLETKYSAIYGL